jgi:hypothetical protein
MTIHATWHYTKNEIARIYNFITKPEIINEIAQGLICGLFASYYYYATQSSSWRKAVLWLSGLGLYTGIELLLRRFEIFNAPDRERLRSKYFLRSILIGRGISLCRRYNPCSWRGAAECATTAYFIVLMLHEEFFRLYLCASYPTSEEVSDDDSAIIVLGGRGWREQDFMSLYRWIQHTQHHWLSHWVTPQLDTANKYKSIYQFLKKYNLHTKEGLEAQQMLAPLSEAEKSDPRYKNLSGQFLGPVAQLFAYRLLTRCQ